MRLRYPTDLRIIRVPCTGKVDAGHILHALEKGADGAFVIGCLEGDCRSKTGNLRARKRIEHVKSILQSIGLEPERVGMYNLSSGEGPKFAQYAREMDSIIRELGPSPLKKARPMKVQKVEAT